MKKKISGLVVPTITVFNNDESLNEGKTKEHVNFLLESGAQGIVGCASTGEFVAMSIEERKKIAEVIVEEVRGRVLVYIHTGHYRTETTIELSQHAEAIGANGIMILLPYCMNPTTPQILEHFRAVTENTKLPIILYDNPWDTGISLSPWDIKRFADEDLISGVKLAHGDVAQVHNVKFLCEDKIYVFYGANNAVVEALLCGADGWISGIHNLLPKICRKLTDTALSGKVIEANKIWRKLLPFVNMEIYPDKNREPHWLSIIKTGLRIMGRDVGEPRRPILSLNKDYERRLHKLLEVVQSDT